MLLWRIDDVILKLCDTIRNFVSLNTSAQLHIYPIMLASEKSITQGAPNDFGERLKHTSAVVKHGQYDPSIGGGSIVAELYSNLIRISQIRSE